MQRGAPNEFPQGFEVQRIGVKEAMAISDLPPAEIVAYFHGHPETAQALLHESYDKRFTPSTFIAQDANRFHVGWFTSKAECQCVRQFTNLAEAATDYLLFSLGLGRWAVGP